MNLNSKKIQAIKPGHLSSICVVDYDLHYALKSWKKMLKDSNIIQECYDRKFFEKKSDKTRKQMEIARYNQYKDSLK